MIIIEHQHDCLQCIFPNAHKSFYTIYMCILCMYVAETVTCYPANPHGIQNTHHNNSWCMINFLSYTKQIHRALKKTTYHNNSLCMINIISYTKQIHRAHKQTYHTNSWCRINFRSYTHLCLEL